MNVIAKQCIAGTGGVLMLFLYKLLFPFSSHANITPKEIAARGALLDFTETHVLALFLIASLVHVLCYHLDQTDLSLLRALLMLMDNLDAMNALLDSKEDCVIGMWNDLTNIQP